MSFLLIDIPYRAARSLLRGVAAVMLAVGGLAVALFRLSPKQYAMLALAVGFVSLAAFQLEPVDALRDDIRRATIVGDVDEGAIPPDIVLLRHTLGGFKTIFVDLVWMRAIRMLNNKEFWELHQLYDWMGKLAPRLEEIWAFNGWNMAFNIVAEVGDSEGRWSWISRSIEWMRDEGMRYNPRSARIAREIAWVYSVKIGKTNDDHHMYYKHRLALEMDRLLGDEQLDWAEVREYPRDLDGLLSHNRDMEMFVRDLGATLVRGDRRAGEAGARRLLRPAEEEYYFDQLDRRVLEVLFKPEHTEARKALRGYMARRGLRDIYKLSLDRMVALEEEYQPMDWRLPDPHAIYYAKLGMEILEERIENAHTLQQAQDLHNTIIDHERIVFEGLRNLYRRGLITHMDPAPNGNIILSQDLDRIELVHEMYVEKIEYEQEIQDKLDEEWRARRARGEQVKPQDVRGLASTRDGHIYFLEEVTENLYYSGQYDRAMRYFREGRERYHKFVKRDGTPYTLDEYALGRIESLVKESGGPHNVSMLIQNMLQKHLMHYAAFQDELASSWGFQARRFWEYFVDDMIQRSQGRVSVEALGLPTFDQLYWITIREIVQGRMAFPPLLTSRLRRRLDLPEEWDEEQEHALMERLKGTDKKLREEAFRKTYMPGGDREYREPTMVEEEMQRREQMERRERMMRRHR